MSRLYDRIMRDSYYRPADPTFLEWLQSAVVIKADNVTEYLFNGYKDDWNLLKDIPTLAPPFNRFWIESKTPRTITFNKSGKIEPFPFNGAFGFLVNIYQEGHQYFQEIANKVAFTEVPYWLYRATLILEMDKHNYGSVWEFAIGVDEMGQMLEPQQGSGQAFIHQPLMTPVTRMIIDAWGFDGTQAFMRQFINPALMAIGLMHCKNVELIDEVPPPKLSKSHEKKYGVPLVKYKVLKVNSMRREYADDDRESQPGIPKSLHICRGHFKDYRNGGGLFGKYEGIYWWDQHVRGDAKRGVVVKDYDVQAPKESED